MPALLAPRHEIDDPEPRGDSFAFSLPEPYPRESDFARACKPDCADRIEEAIVRVMVRHGLGGAVIV